MTISEIPFHQKFLFETNTPRPLSIPDVTPAVMTSTIKPDWQKIIMVSAVIVIAGVVTYKIWKLYQEQQEELKV